MIREAVKQARLHDLAPWREQPRHGLSFLCDQPEHIQEVLNPPSLPSRKEVSRWCEVLSVRADQNGLIVIAMLEMLTPCSHMASRRQVGLNQSAYGRRRLYPRPSRLGGKLDFVLLATEHNGLGEKSSCVWPGQDGMR